ncbi:hypothetical protein DUI87_24957 [Hirundo rustica rustica]|uniref:Rna-directed dna polymerase from mobile element jockey-like n=1 Tax=Hirundo rustica rustica TaxID=333673 RepID=A0A3M0JD15_HIRRU|nr:hypothetical protein DUI87_24957 [Hirundo rustica rustica]
MCPVVLGRAALGTVRASSGEGPPDGESGVRGADVGTGIVHTFVGNMDSGIELTLSRFAKDTKLCGTVSTLEGRDLDRLERWVHVNLTKVSKAKCKVLHLVQGNPKKSVEGRLELDDLSGPFQLKSFYDSVIIEKDCCSLLREI